MEGGVPSKNHMNQYDTWCQQLGGKFVSVTYGVRNGGYVVGCTNCDDVNWHWCDVTDGCWYNQALQGGTPGLAGEKLVSITSLTCSGTIAGNEINKYHMIVIHVYFLPLRI